MSLSAYKSTKSGAYAAGFILSLGLTLASFALVWRYQNTRGEVFSSGFLMVWIVALALVQLLTQLIFFLHLGRESKPRWNLSVTAFALIVVVILVFGSLWIMQNLNYHSQHQASPQTTGEQVIEDEGFGDH